MAKRILLFFLIFSALPVIATTRQIIDKFVSDPAFIPSSIGICITDVKTGETIASYNERQAVIPASTIKVRLCDCIVPHSVYTRQWDTPEQSTKQELYTETL